MQDTEVRQLLERHARGGLTDHEAVSALVQAAAARKPMKFAPLLPASLLVDIERAAANPPITPDFVLFVESMSQCLEAPPGFNWDTHRDACAQRYYDGAWQWHWYFEALAIQRFAA